MRPNRLDLQRLITAIAARLASRFSLADFLGILLLGFVALAYGFALLNFDPNLGITGGEYQVHVGSMTLINQWLSGEIEFPLWNPIVGYGRSLIADPYLIAFNPFVSLPMATLGLVNGTKVAAVLNFFIAGLGVWFLTRTLGFKRLASTWCSLLYMLSGALPAHLAAGQIQLTFSLGWLPWSVAGVMWVIKRRSLLAVALASLALALFFFTGNLYHQVYGFFALLIIGLVFVVDWQEFRLRRGIAGRILLLGLFSLGLTAIQILPMFTSLPSIRNTGGYIPGDDTFAGSQRPEHAFLNYVVADPEFTRDPVLSKIAIPQESYRFIGVGPVLALLFLVPAYRRGHRREIIAFAASFLFLLAWAGLGHTFVKHLYEFLPILYQFRFPGRALSAGALFLLVLSGYGVDHLWQRLQRGRASSIPDEDRSTSMLTRFGSSLASALLILGLVLAVRRVYVANRELLYTEKIYRRETDLAVEWLLAQDMQDLTFDATPTISDRVALASYEHSLRSPSFNEGWRAGEAPYMLGKPDALPIRPAYRLDWEWENYAGSEYAMVDQIGELRIWQAVESYPYAFTLPAERLLLPAQILPAEVHPATAHRREGPNTIAVDIQATDDSILVISEAWFNGWTVKVDGQPANLVSVSNFLAVEVSPGRHEVRFEYAPASFTVGLILSGLTLLIIAGIALQSLLRAVWVNPS